MSNRMKNPRTWLIAAGLAGVLVVVLFMVSALSRKSSEKESTFDWSSISSLTQGNSQNQNQTANTTSSSSSTAATTQLQPVSSAPVIADVGSPYNRTLTIAVRGNDPRLDALAEEIRAKIPGGVEAVQDYNDFMRRGYSIQLNAMPQELRLKLVEIARESDLQFFAGILRNIMFFAMVMCGLAAFVLWRIQQTVATKVTVTPTGFMLENSWRAFRYGEQPAIVDATSGQMARLSPKHGWDWKPFGYQWRMLMYGLQHDAGTMQLTADAAAMMREDTAGTTAAVPHLEVEIVAPGDDGDKTK